MMCEYEIKNDLWTNMGEVFRYADWNYDKLNADNEDFSANSKNHEEVRYDSIYGFGFVTNMIRICALTIYSQRVLHSLW